MREKNLEITHYLQHEYKGGELKQGLRCEQEILLVWVIETEYNRLNIEGKPEKYSESNKKLRNVFCKERLEGKCYFI